MQLVIRSLLFWCHAFAYIYIAVGEMINVQESQSQVGRIATLDGVLKKYKEEIATGGGIHKLLAELEEVSKTLKPTKESKGSAEYYIHVAELLERQGHEALRYEDQRIQDVLTQAMASHDREVKKATKERRVLDAYYEAAASYFSGQIELDGTSFLNDFNPHDDVADAFKADSASHALRRPPRKMKVVKEHEEM